MSILVIFFWLLLQSFLANSDYVSIRIYTSPNCSESGFITEWILPLPTLCTDKPFSDYSSYVYDSNSGTINYTIFEDVSCDEQIINETVFQVNSCDHYKNNLSISWYLNFTVLTELPYNESTMTGWSLVNRFKDEYCESRIDEFMDLDAYSLHSHKAVSIIESQEIADSYNFCTENYFVVVYVELFRSRKIIPRSSLGTCFSNWEKTLFEESSFSAIFDCLSDSEAKEIRQNFPSNSSHSHMLFYSSNDENCDRYCGVNPVMLDREGCKLGLMTTATENLYITTVFDDFDNCSGSEVFYGIKLSDGPLILDICEYTHSNQLEETIKYYVSFVLSNDPYFSTHLALGRTDVDSCESEIETYIRNPELFTEVYYFLGDSCSYNQGSDSSIRGSCEDGILHLSVYYQSKYCLGDYFDVIPIDDFGVNQLCMYSPTELKGDYLHYICISRYCNDIIEFDEDVCSGHGSCIGTDECECEGDYVGDTCSTFLCYEIDRDNEEEVCNGHGNCIGHNHCQCEENYYGDQCDVVSSYDEDDNGGADVITFVSIFVPLTVSSIFVTVFLLLLCCVFCCCFCCIIICCCCVVVLGVCSINLFQKKKIDRFRELNNFEILLAEQKLEHNPMIAHLKINKKLFEIEFENIKNEKVIGEGGSDSVVYLSKWRNKIVAFKCFRTRDLQDQNVFDEFERELSILSSVSHPNIVRFFGATLKPPRIGIVMEYCSNGDLGSFLFILYPARNNEKKYPSNGKLRILKEIALGMEYLHSRNVIHRDIKLENILIDECEHCKIMDFGLSKIVDRMSQNKTQRIGTSIYIAPEVVLQSKYDEKCDVFSFAIMLFIIISQNRYPYGGSEICVELKTAQDPNFRPNLEEIQEESEHNNSLIYVLKNIMETCWSHNPDDRLDFKTIGEKLEKIEENDEIDQERNLDDYMDYEKNKNRVLEREETRSDDDGESEVEDKYVDFEEKCKILEERVKLLEVENKKLKQN